MILSFLIGQFQLKILIQVGFKLKSFLRDFKSL